VAAFGRANGIAAGALLQQQAFHALGIDAELVDATPALRNPFHRVPHSPGTTYIFHCGAPQTPNLLSAVLPHAARAWRIGYWAWELPDPPPDWVGCDHFVAEIWTPSQFSQASLLQLTGRPVRVAPHAVPVRAARRRDASLPFTVLAMADCRSSLTRKNPAGALEAFIGAFGTSRAARLILKLNGAGVDAALEERATAAPNVEIVRGFLDAGAMAALYRSADVLLSPHRAEGFGLPMLEAMAYGVPVVGTGWSGNLDFMDEGSSILLPFRLTRVSDAAGIYAGSHWAEPDLSAAAAILRRLAEDQFYYAAMARAAHAAASSRQVQLPLDAPLEQTAPAGPRLPAAPGDLGVAAGHP
jgi:glycosyltransferase involved in cell wall biosynthesis